MRHNLWTREELLLALNLYCKTPFGQYHQHNPEVIKLAERINRTPSAVAMKLANFASLDDGHKQRGLKGLGNVSRADRELWEEFTHDWNEVAFEGEKLLTKVSSEGNVKDDYAFELSSKGKRISTETESIVKLRLGQRFFRKTILANYRSRCCICGIPIPELLIASHIIPWREREDLRLNPHNGLCLCAIHDKAFDSGLLAIDNGYRVLISPQVIHLLPQEGLQTNFEIYDGRDIALPDKFLPDKGFLAFHLQTYFD